MPTLPTVPVAAHVRASIYTASRLQIYRDIGCPCRDYGDSTSRWAEALDCREEEMPAVCRLAEQAGFVDNGSGKRHSSPLLARYPRKVLIFAKLFYTEYKTVYPLLLGAKTAAANAGRYRPSLAVTANIYGFDSHHYAKNSVYKYIGDTRRTK